MARRAGLYTRAAEAVVAWLDWGDSAAGGEGDQNSALLALSTAMNRLAGEVEWQRGAAVRRAAKRKRLFEAMRAETLRRQAELDQAAAIDADEGRYS